MKLTKCWRWKGNEYDVLCLAKPVKCSDTKSIKQGYFITAEQIGDLVEQILLDCFIEDDPIKRPTLESYLNDLGVQE